MVYQSRPTLSAARARQGRFGHMIWLLLFGVLLAALGLFAAWTWRAPELAATDAGKDPRPAARNFKSPEPAPLETSAPAKRATS